VVDDFIPICEAEATYHNGRNQTDTETGDDTATDEETDSSRSDLEGDTDGEDAASDDDRQPSSDPIREGSTEESTKERSSRENRGDQTLLPSVDIVACSLLLEMRSKKAAGALTAAVTGRSVTELPLEEGHSKNSVDVAGVVAEKDTAEGRKGAEHVPPCGNGGLDPSYVAGHDSSLIGLTIRL
jgi:hypothetical protein